MLKNEIIPEIRLFDAHIAVRVPFGIVSPGKIKLSFPCFSGLLCHAEGRDDHEQHDRGAYSDLFHHKVLSSGFLKALQS
jgi:hypothetical protein